MSGQWRSDIINVKIGQQDVDNAQSIAEQQVDNYYDRCGYSRDIRISKIKDGYIGERIFHKYIEEQLEHYSKEDLSIINFVCGNDYSSVGPDQGWDFSFGKNNEETFDIKCYAMREKSVHDAMVYIYNQFHLLIDQDQAMNTKKSKYYVPVFYMPKSLNGFVAGVQQGLPEMKVKFKRDSYAKRVCDLEPTSIIFSKIISRLFRDGPS